MLHNDAEQFSRLLAQRLRDLADEQGLSQNRLSKESGVSQSQISRIFSFDRSVSVDQLIAIAETLGVSPSQVVGRVEEQMKASARTLSVVEDNLESEDFLSEPYAANQPGYSPRDEQEPELP